MDELMQNRMVPGLTRRYFLEQLGRVGGAAAVTLAMNAFGIPTATARERPPELRGSGKGKKVLVLGAGHAGNTSAYELAKLGYEVTVLEARSFAGGRAQTARRGFTAHEMGGEAARCDFDEGQYLNIGPWRIPYHHRATLHYTKQFDVPLEIMVNDNDAAFLYSRKGKGPLAGKPVRQGEIKADARGYAGELVAKAAASGRLDGMITAEDKEIFLEYMRHEGYLGADFSYKGTDGRGWKVHPGAGLNPGVESEPYAFSDVLNSQLWRHFTSVTEIDMQWTMFQPVGGMDQIARGFERHMGHLIKYDTEVEQIRQSDKGVTAHWVDTKTGRRGSTTADYAICTIPLSVLHRMDTDFSDSFKGAMEGVAYAPVLKAGLQMKRRFWEEDFSIYGGHIWSDHNNGYGMYTISLPSTGWQSRKGVLLGAYLFGDVAVQTSALSLKDRMESCLAIGEEIFPGLYRANYEKGFSWCWHRAKYNQGGWAEWSKAGRAKDYPTLLEPDRRIYLAGEHLSYMTGWQCGAFESAWMQIEKLHNRAQQA
jgi:monoamine oxidase